MLKITDQKGNIYYGGNQDWYSSNTRAMAGCSSVSAANALRLLAQKDATASAIFTASSRLSPQCKRALIKRECSKNDFLMLMTDVYDTMGSMEIFPLNILYDKKERGNKLFKILKPNNGRSSIGFIVGSLLYAKKSKLYLTCRALPTAFINKETALSFIKEGLNKSGSVVILTSYNKHPLRLFSAANIDKLNSGQLHKCHCTNADMKCHFANITGINGSDLYITTWGKIASVSIDDLVKSWQSIKAFESSLFYFERSSKSEMYKSLLTSPLPFIKGIIQSIKRAAR